jgi:Protein of unknown function (DUF3071)
MRTLRLVALSDDGRSLVLTTDGPDGGEERFELPIDERVRAAARGDARLGAIEDLGNTLPPRVIQARIRAGETPEQVALASGTRIDRVMRFAHPVLQERARIAEQSLQARVRLSEGTPAGTLQEFMAERLRLLGADLDVVRWDAARSADGGWTVTGAWTAGAKSGVTRWGFDIPARQITPLDATTRDFAEGTRLVRVVPDVPGGSGPLPQQPAAGHGPDQPPAAEARTEPDTRAGGAPSPALPAVPQPLDRTSAPPFERARDERPAQPFDEPFDDDISEHDTVVLGRTDDGEDDDPRARVPAWEDIVFGIRRHR